MNLIITCSRHLESEAAQEIHDILEELGDDDSTVDITHMSGIVTAVTSLDPFVVVEKIKKRILDEPWSIRYCLRIIPIQETVATEKEEIVNAVIKHAAIIESKDTYRITVEKRHSAISTSEIISGIADKIHSKVSLEQFEWIILVEILGNKTGISVLKEANIVSTQKLKRSLSE
ncbi:MAG TPA: THUMP domain-containing protein [Nitrosopumilaceae archaeon]|nr:THUMP domain-containing protein [Nitrosopumilaceae archaeon]